MSERGYIKFYDSLKDYGFIGWKGNKDVYFNKDSFKGKEPSKDDKVEFDLEKRGDRMRAINLRIVQCSSCETPEKDIPADRFDVEKVYIPKDTKNTLKSLADINNFNLKFNKMARFETKKFEFFKTDKKTRVDEIKPCFPYDLIENINERNKKTLNDKFKPENVHTCICASEWRMIVGFGNESVYELSMTLHHIYGIPYIPGSAIKGVTRHWGLLKLFESSEIDRFEEIGCLESFIESGKIEDHKISYSLNDFRNRFGYKVGPDNVITPSEKLYSFLKSKVKEIEDFREVFGTQEKAGKIFFFDAYPTDEIHLKIDVMTPHYPKYYSGAQFTYPTDDQNPTPINFLTVENTKFCFHIAGYDNNLLNKTEDCLKDALQNHGIGAKTSVGYGYFSSIK